LKRGAQSHRWGAEKSREMGQQKKDFKKKASPSPLKHDTRREEEEHTGSDGKLRRKKST